MKKIAVAIAVLLALAWAASKAQSIPVVTLNVAVNGPVSHVMQPPASTGCTGSWTLVPGLVRWWSTGGSPSENVPYAMQNNMHWTFTRIGGLWRASLQGHPHRPGTKNVSIGGSCVKGTDQQHRWQYTLRIVVTGTAAPHLFDGHLHPDAYMLAAEAAEAYATKAHEHPALATGAALATALTRINALEFAVSKFQCAEEPASFWDRARTTDPPAHVKARVFKWQHCCIPSEPDQTIDQCFAPAAEQQRSPAPLAPTGDADEPELR